MTPSSASEFLNSVRDSLFVSNPQKFVIRMYIYGAHVEHLRSACKRLEASVHQANALVNESERISVDLVRICDDFLLRSANQRC